MMMDYPIYYKDISIYCFYVTLHVFSFETFGWFRFQFQKCFVQDFRKDGKHINTIYGCLIEYITTE